MVHQTIIYSILVISLALSVPVAFGHVSERSHVKRHTHSSTSHHPDEAARSPTPRELLETFRRNGNDAYLDLAWAKLQPALQNPEVSARTWIDAAAIAQARHEFEQSLEFLDRALTLDPRNEQAWLLKASVHLVLGETEQAASACAQLARASLLVVVGCRSRVEIANGQMGGAGQQLLAILEARQKMADADNGAPAMAWAWSIAGDLMVLRQQLDAAVGYYKHSLGMRGNAQVRAAMVDALIEMGSWHEAGQALEDADALPLKVRRHIIDKKLQRADSHAIEHMDHEFETWIAAKDWLHAREMARFYIDVIRRPALARELALINIALQREHEDVRLELRTRPKS